MVVKKKFKRKKGFLTKILIIGPKTLINTSKCLYLILFLNDTV